MSRSRRVCKGKAVHDCLTRLTSRNAAVHLHQHGGGGGTWKGEEPRELSRQAVGRGWNAGGGGAVAAVDGRLSTAGDQKTQRLVSSPELRKALFPTAIIHVERRRGADS